MRILMATDGSAHARLAEAVLARLPLTRGASVVAATVTASPSMTTALLQAWATFDFGQENLACVEAMRAHAKQVAQEAAKRLRDRGLAAAERVLEGDAALELVEVARRESFDMVVCGTRSHSPIQAFLLGSVARKLVARTDCSVLVAHPFAGMTPEASAARLESGTRLRALVAVDGSPGADAALDAVAAMDGDAFGRVTTLCVEPIAMMPLMFDVPAQAPKFDGPSPAERIAAAAAERLAGTADTVQAKWLRERPASGILTVAQEIDADIIVLGAAHHTGVERLLMGSVSYEVAVSAPCPVLVVRRRG